MASRLRWILPGALAVAVAAAFAPALWCGFVNWDDSKVVVENTHVRGLSPRNIAWAFTTRFAGHFQPLTWLSLQFDYAIWGLRPAGYHVVNLLLHAASAVLAYVLLLELLVAAGADARRMRTRLAALAGAAFWALHPLRVESVVWITERRDVLSVALYLPVLLCYLRMQRESGPSRRKWLLASLGFAILSGMAKAWTVTLPAVLLVLDTYPLRRWSREAASRVLVEKAPFAALALVVGLLAFDAQRRTGAMLEATRYTVGQRVAVAGYGLVFYPVKTVAPAKLSPLYPADPDVSPVSGRFVAGWLAVAAAAAVCYAARRTWPALPAGAAAYAIVVSPVLGLTQVGPQEVADRYAYLSCLAWSAVLAAVFVTQAGARVAAAVLAVVIAGLAGLTFAQAGVWTDSRTLWDHAVRANPRNYVAICNRAQWSMEAGEYRRAIREFEAALAVKPGYAQAYAGRGSALLELGELAAAVEDLDRAIRLGPAPVRAQALVSRGIAYMKLGEAGRARADFDEAIRRDRESANAWANRGTARASLGDFAGAVEDFTEALALDPDWAELWVKRGVARAQLGEPRPALEDLNRSLELRPEYADALFYRGQVWKAAGRADLAKQDFEQALRVAPREWPSRGAASALLKELP